MQSQFDGTPLFRQLTDEEELTFRLWARDNWQHGMNVSELWHPIVRDEIDKMEAEYQAQASRMVM